MRSIFFILIVIFLLIGSYFLSQRKTPQTTPRELAPISLALDWTPNTNHTGFYVALAKGWYKEEGIDLKIVPFSSTVSPDVLVSTGKADVGISATESVVANSALGQSVISIAAILQHNTSSLAVLADSGITRPLRLDGKVYGGFGIPSEKAVVEAIIKKDGGQGNIQNIVLDTAAMEALKSHRIDVFWIYEGWEGIQAKREGLILTTFPLTEFGIPDYYTPVIITSSSTIKQKEAILKKFMRATARGYEHAREHPKEAAQMLIDQSPNGTFPDIELVFASQEYLSPRYADKWRKWGLQDAKAWQEYPQFLLDSGAITDGKGEPIKTIDFSRLYTNEFLK